MNTGGHRRGGGGDDVCRTRLGATARRMRRATAPLLSLLLSVWLPDAHGWGEKGHQVIAHLAERRLTPEVAAEIKRLLASEPDSSLAAVSTWADHLRVKSEFRFTLRGHFIEIPLSADGGDLQGYCPDDDCITASLTAVRKALADPAMDLARRSQALKFFVHLVADVHQPLHCADNGDRGGNMVRVRHRADPTNRQAARDSNLHAAWDSKLVDDIVVEDARALASAIDSGLTTSQVSAWSAVRDPIAWTWECFRIAKAVAYGNPPLLASGAAIPLDDDYVKLAHQTIREQFAKAGVRLAIELNRALGRPGQASIKDLFYPEPRRESGPTPPASSPRPGEQPGAAPTEAPPANAWRRVLWPSIGGAAGMAIGAVVVWWRRNARRRRVFVSYRRATTQGHAGRIADHLGRVFGPTHVFRDVDSVSPGEDFIDAIDRRLAVCDAVVAVFGPGWAADPRLREPDDYVRRELTRALDAGIPVIPVFVQDAAMPAPSELPEDLRKLSRTNAISIVDHLFSASVGALVKAIRQLPRRPSPEGRDVKTTAR